MDHTAIVTLKREGRHEEALTLGREMLRDTPDDAQLHFEVACLNDFLGHEAQAVAHYRAALDGSLDPAVRHDALLGLGSTLRVLARYAEALATLTQAVQEFPQSCVLEVFRSMALHNAGQSGAGIEALLRVVAATSADPEIRAYRRAIELYAEDIERSWT